MDIKTCSIAQTVVFETSLSTIPHKCCISYYVMHNSLPLCYKQDTGTLRSTVSLPVPNMQASLDCGPVGEIHIPRGKRGKIHMHIWSDTLERCKRTGKTNFQLLPLLDEEHETNTEASRM